jgi:hypothetical protein
MMQLETDDVNCNLSRSSKSWSFSEGLALEGQPNLIKNKPCLERPICGVEKVKLTYSHSRLGFIPQIERPLPRIVVPLVYFRKQSER